MSQPSSNAVADLLSPSFLFRYRLPCRKADPLWTGEAAILPDRHQLADLGELEGGPQFADVRAGWSDDGLVFSVRVSGKTKQPWCRESRPEDSDGLHVWIDTRDTHNIHRASRFCHRFAFIPFGAGDDKSQPFYTAPPIHRAKENPKPAPPSTIEVASERHPDGYTLHAVIAAAALTGYDPAEHRRLGFFYLVSDHELGWQTLSVGAGWPFQEDPSLWATLDLVTK